MAGRDRGSMTHRGDGEGAPPPPVAASLNPCGLPLNPAAYGCVQGYGGHCRGMRETYGYTYAKSVKHAPRPQAKTVRMSGLSTPISIPPRK